MIRPRLDSWTKVRQSDQGQKVGPRLDHWTKVRQSDQGQMVGQSDEGWTIAPHIGQNNPAWLFCFYRQFKQNKREISAMHLFCVKELLKWNKSVLLSPIMQALLFWLPFVFPLLLACLLITLGQRSNQIIFKCQLHVYGTENKLHEYPPQTSLL